tara:strand:+ start:239 stop:1540 length:1302 start_codon:yes stop_codon:yes gene_type:complete
MAIADMLKSFGQGIDRGFTKIGGYDPSQQVSPEEALMRKNAGIEALQRTLGRSSAILSGDPQRLALSAQQDEAARKKQFMEDYIRKNPGQAELLRALQAGVPASMLTGGKAGSIERFGVYDPKTNKLIGTVLKKDTQKIGELEAEGYTVGQLRSPTIPTSKEPSMNTWAITNASGNRVKDLVNPTQEELNKEIKAGNFVNKTPVLSTAGKGAVKEQGKIKGWDDDEGLLERAKGFNGLVSSGNRIIENLYNNPGSVLLTGDFSQVFSQMSEEMSAMGYLIDPKKKDSFVNKATSNVRDEFRTLAASTSITESQLLDFAYQIAKVRGQEGRGLSDQDFKNFQKIISAGRTADQKIAALTNFIEGIQVEVESAIGQEKKYRDLQIGRNPEDKEAATVLQGISDVYNVGFSSIFNPYAQQQTSATGKAIEDPLGIR